jgi:hypothetical protein
MMFDNNSTHSIYDPVSDMTIPMDLKCAVSYFDSYAPTLDMPVIVLTSSTNWEQTAADFSNQHRVATITHVCERPGDLVSHLFLPDHPAFPTEKCLMILNCVNVLLLALMSILLNSLKQWRRLKQMFTH